ncbi:hypothetical protein QBC47DRAFT_184512 [Echria macrotheca]|uniref:Uncharacterized protein n=1 Tax=Echria macrotheca TaxID=438768 RepID=A0AAJ0BDJ5_9PEZI|nr:hypothetical protein QBC47DRAFT_184512 [Echria macrotheca]
MLGDEACHDKGKWTTTPVPAPSKAKLAPGALVLNELPVSTSSTEPTLPAPSVPPSPTAAELDGCQSFHSHDCRGSYGSAECNCNRTELPSTDAAVPPATRDPEQPYELEAISRPGELDASNAHGQTVESPESKAPSTHSTETSGALHTSDRPTSSLDEPAHGLDSTTPSTRELGYSGDSIPRPGGSVEQGCDSVTEPEHRYPRPSLDAEWSEEGMEDTQSHRRLVDTSQRCRDGQPPGISYVVASREGWQHSTQPNPSWTESSFPPVPGHHRPGNGVSPLITQLQGDAHQRRRLISSRHATHSASNHPVYPAAPQRPVAVPATPAPSSIITRVWPLRGSKRGISEAQLEKVLEFMSQYNVPRWEDEKHPVDTLLNWMHVAIRDQNASAEAMQKERARFSEDRQRFRGNIAGLEKRCSNTEVEWKKACSANSSLQSRLDKTEKKLGDATSAIAAWGSSWTAQKRFYEDAIRQREEDIEKLRQRVCDLENYLAAQRKEPAVFYEATSDQVFKKAIQTLSQSINNLAVSVPQPTNYRAVPTDRTGYLGRRWNLDRGENAWRRFLHSLCLDVLFDGFFYWPLGFGVFGKEGEKRDPRNREVSLPGEDRATRANFFSLMLKMVEHPNEPPSREGKGSEALLHSVRAFKANMDRTVTELLTQLESSSGASLGPSSWTLATAIVHNAGRLALRMGSQRAHVMLQRPPHRDSVTLGEYFGNETGSFIIGTTAQVDLVLEPCMVRIGDGGDDLTSIKVIAPGSIVALD